MKIDIDKVHCFTFADEYVYGYDTGPNGQFHYENKGPDGVVYGCYGYVDPENMLRVTHYIADAHGYQTVEPNKPTSVWLDAGQEAAENDEYVVTCRVGDKN